MDGVIGLGIGFFVGVTFGIFLTSLLVAAREGDNLIEYLDSGVDDGEDDKR